MAQATVQRLYPMNRTIGRFIEGASVQTVGAGLRLLGMVAPAAADRVAAELFLRPRGPRGERSPEVPGLTGHRFHISIPGKRLAVWDFGEGPTVLLVHGWNGRAAQMSAFIGPLVAAGYYVAALDLPAHGASEGKSTNVLEIRDAIQELANRTRPVHAVIAHSLGGTATALALARGLSVERGVFVASPTNFPPFARRLAESLGLSEARTAGLIEALSREVAPPEEIDLTRRIPARKTPLLLLHDPNDREVPFTESEALSRAWPGSTVVPLKGLGHRRPLKDREVVRRVVDFLREDPEVTVRLKAV